ncbi:MAG: potassium transporter TrkH [Verrucomicrobia bacterium]|nr:potassium transporter TrkH [Verrucomicrobiota bacterium]
MNKAPLLARRREVDLRIVPLGFLALIAVGTALLVLPWAHRSGQSVGFLDAFFLAASAACVTGLTTLNVAETFNGFGQAILLLLLQAGGLGIFTASISLVLLSGQRLSLADEQTIHATVGRLRQARPLDVFIYGCVFVLLFELAGTVALFPQIAEAESEHTVWQSLWEAAFHAISAFCNAGISVYPEGLARWKQHPGMLAVIDVLVMAGGIGLMTLINLRYYYFWRRDPRRRGHLTLQTRLAVMSAVLLLVAGAAVTLVFEWNHTLAEAHGWERVSWSFFHSAMTRTAGFNVVDVGEMNPPTLLATLVLMFIGGSPGSMAGGIKTVTVVLLVLTAWTALKRREDLQIFGRRIGRELAGIAVMLTLLAGACVLAGVGLLMLTEDGHPAAQTSQRWLALVFEAVSAFGTVGLSAGVTPLLTAAGKLIIIVLMFVGRVGPLVLSVYLARAPYPWHVRYPREEVAIG